MGDMSGQGAVITGGAGDIGAAMAHELHRRGAAVTLIDRRTPAEAAPWIARAAGDAGSAAAMRYLQADTRDRAAIDAALAAIEPLDIAIGNAGVGVTAPFLDLGAEEWAHTLDVNLTGSFHLGQAAARLMVRRGHPGRIIFTGSWVGEVPWPDIAAYSASKAGIRMLARSMARELAPHGIRVNVVAPGIVDAGLARHLIETDPAYARRIKGVVPLGQLQTPEQVARATAFLCSADADYMTGAVLLVDGGCSLFQFDQAEA